MPYLLRTFGRLLVMSFGGFWLIFVLGDDCNEDFDACAVNPCSVGRNCTDIPAEHQNSSLAYTCSPCPTGYTDSGVKCEGKSKRKVYGVKLDTKER